MTGVLREPPACSPPSVWPQSKYPGRGALPSVILVADQTKTGPSWLHPAQHPAWIGPEGRWTQGGSRGLLSLLSPVSPVIPHTSLGGPRARQSCPWSLVPRGRAEKGDVRPCFSERDFALQYLCIFQDRAGSLSCQGSLGSGMSQVRGPSPIGQIDRVAHTSNRGSGFSGTHSGEVSVWGK